MTDRELMQMAFKAMDSVNEFSSNSIYAGIFDWEVKILRDRLAQPEPDYSKAGFVKPRQEEGCAECGKKASDGWALYCVKCTEREWKWLTDEEIEQIVDTHWNDPSMFIEAIEAKLKEKNHDS
jgi:hypothetical protein